MRPPSDSLVCLHDVCILPDGKAVAASFPQICVLIFWQYLKLHMGPEYGHEHHTRLFKTYNFKICRVFLDEGNP